MDRSAPGLRLPKIPVEVELALVGGTTQRVRVFVAPYQEHTYRRQHLLDLLEGPDLFLPAEAVGEEGAGTVLTNKAMVVWAAINLDDGSLPVEEEPESFEPELYDIQTHVRVDLEDHDALTGQVLYSPPTGHARVADYLNRVSRFFRVWTSDRLYLVNKDHAIRVAEQGDAE